MKPHDRAINSLVRVAVEVLWLENFSDLVDRLVLQKQAAENSLFSLKILRRKFACQPERKRVGSRIPS